MVSLALLLTRLYAPLTALANARVEIMSAVVSFERVFEVLDLQPLITDKPDAVTVPARPGSRSSFDHVRFAYPSADKVSLASLEEVAMLDTRGGEEVIHDVSFTAGTGPDGRPGRQSSGAGKSTIAQLATRLYDVDAGCVLLGGLDIRDVDSRSLRRLVGMVTQDGHLFHDTVRAATCCSPGPRPPSRTSGTRCAARASTAWWSTARRSRHRRRRAGLPLVRR